MRTQKRSLRWWWWNLPLRRKGWVVIGVPLLVLAPTALATLVLNIQQDHTRADVRQARLVQEMSEEVQVHLLELEKALLQVAAGDPVALSRFDEARADVGDDIAALAAVEPRDLTAAAARAAEDHVAELTALRQVPAADAPAAGAPVDLRAVAATSAEAAEEFGALDAATTAANESGRDRMDRRSGVITALSILGILLAAAAGIVMIRVFTRSIVRRIDGVNEITTKVLDGDFALEVEETGRDELGVLFEKLRDAAALLITMNDDLSSAAAEERERLERERQLRHVLRTVHGAVGSAGILDAVVRELGIALDADRALMMAAEDGGIGPIVAEWCSEPLGQLGLGQRLPPDPQRDAKIQQAIAEGTSIVVDDIATSEELLPQTRTVLGQLGVGSLLMMPVVADDQPLGVLVLLTAGRSRPWPSDSQHLTRSVTGEAATALAQARLFEREQQIVEQLRELDQTRADFVASVSHELRTPLTSIRGYVEMLEDGDGGELTDEQAHMLKVVHRNADRLLALIEDLLTLSRIESGSFRVALAPTDLGALVRATVDELGPQAQAQGVRLIADVDDDVAPVMGDTQQLERVLLNLLSNAIKFTTGGGDVEVGLSAEDGEVVLRVTDHGIGIAAAELSKLFGRFFRSSTAQEFAIPGTGLGLVIVQSIIDHHNGRIEVESTLGQGTTFTVRMPSTAPAPASATVEVR